MRLMTRAVSRCVTYQNLYSSGSHQWQFAHSKPTRDEIPEAIRTLPEINKEQSINMNRSYGRNPLNRK